MKLTHVLTLIFLALFSSFAFAVDEPTYNQIVIFGDSLSDNGNLYHTTLGLVPKSPPYYTGRFSNGPVWSDVVADYFTNENKTPTVNYAIGGETVNFHGPWKGLSPFTFTASLDSYYLHTAFQDKTHTLFIIWLGGNDYLRDGDPEQATNDVMSTMEKNIESLIHAGGKSFLLVNLPDLAFIPINSSNQNRDALHTLTILHNDKLLKLTEKLQQANPDIKLRLFDIFNTFGDMTKNLDAYNQKYQTHIKNITDACWDGSFSGAAMTVNEAEILKTLQTDYQQQTAMNFDNHKTFDLQSLAHYVATTPSLREAYFVSRRFENNKTACAQPDDYAFWDHIHPTAAVHGILGKLFIEEISNFHYTQ